MNISNYYDRLNVDVNELFKNKMNIEIIKMPSFIKRFIKRYLFALLIKADLINPMVENGFINGWFKEYRKYWSHILNGRPMYLHDFYYLLGVYRQRFQNVETPLRADKKAFLDSWQNKDTMYQLFGAVRRFSREPIHSKRFEKWIKNGDSILEYGCGIAPISHSLLNASLKINLKITIADINQINFHYAVHRLGNNVEHFVIEPFESSIKKSN